MRIIEAAGVAAAINQAAWRRRKKRSGEISSVMA
jgi:hypothetical protein